MENLRIYVYEVEMQGVIQAYDPINNTFLIHFIDDSYGEVSDEYIEVLH